MYLFVLLLSLTVGESSPAVQESKRRKILFTPQETAQLLVPTVVSPEFEFSTPLTSADPVTVTPVEVSFRAPTVPILRIPPPPFILKQLGPGEAFQQTLVEQDFDEIHGERIVGREMFREASAWVDAFDGPLVEYVQEILVKEEQLIAVDTTRRLFVRRTSTVFETSDPEVILKYELNCDTLKSVHPLVREAVILKRIADFDISMKFLYLSSPIKFQLPLTPKTAVKLDIGSIERCAAVEHSSVRVMALERADRSLDQPSRDGVPVTEALEKTVRVLQLLERLHALDIVHGDIHPGNIVVRRSKSGGELRLIDFGKSFFNSDFVGKPEFERSEFAYVHCFYSPWNLKGARFGFRDDLFKTMHVLAVLLMGDPFVDHCLSLDKDGPAMYAFKNEGYYFANPANGHDPIGSIAGVSEENRSLIRSNLEMAMEIARNQPHVDAPAPLSDVRSLLEDSLALLTR